MSSPLTGLILQPTYRVRQGVPVVLLYGRLDDGRPFRVEDDRFRPYFFAPREAARLLESQSGASVADTDLRSLAGEPLLRVVADVPGTVPRLRDRLAEAGLPALEADIRFPYRYLIDRGLRAAVEIEGEASAPDPRHGGLVGFRNPTLRPGRSRARLRVVSIDLETPRDASAIWSAALVGDGVDEVHLLHEAPVAGAVVHRDERDLVDAVARRIRELDPDVLTGWNVVDFDLRTFQGRADALRLRAPLGRDEGNLLFQQDLGFTRQSRATVPGRMVLDGIPLVRDAIRLPDYRLETAARHVLGRGKHIDHEAADKAAEIARLYREEPEALVAYNREDARLVIDILEHEGLLELTRERSLLSGMQLDRVGASVASFDLLYLPELRRRGLVAPSVDASRKSALVRGGAVLDSRPGLFEDVALFDFKSLYPSLIRTFNLDPLAHARAAAEEGDDGSAIRAPNGALFSRDDAILPGIVERFMQSRDEARRRGDRHADQAIKIMMNSLFGVLGAAGCRFFDPEVANAITWFGQQTLQWTREAFEAEDVTVLYGDTDSVFVQLPAAGQAGRALAGSLREQVEATIAGRIRDQYGVTPRLELELEGIYQRFFMPRVRGGRSGSKKRYAGLRDGELEVVGLESVRRDWPAVAGRLQRGILTRVFHDQPAMPFVREVATRLKAGELDEELVYVKRVRKGSVDSYATAAPHVGAARKASDRLGGEAGGIVHYVITSGGAEPVLPGGPLPGGIDHAHYVDKVLRPIADSILEALGQSFDEALDQPRQLSLL
ncbi:MAG: DNA polymerase II [Myxococcota bacterium]